MPPGCTASAPSRLPGWKVSSQDHKLAKPIKTDDGTVTEEVSEVDMTGGRSSPATWAVPAWRSTCPARRRRAHVQDRADLQRRHVVRWIGAAGSDSSRRRPLTRRRERPGTGRGRRRRATRDAACLGDSGPPRLRSRRSRRRAARTPTERARAWRSPEWCSGGLRCCWQPPRSSRPGDAWRPDNHQT